VDAFHPLPPVVLVSMNPASCMLAEKNVVAGHDVGISEYNVKNFAKWKFLMPVLRGRDCAYRQLRNLQRKGI
jgi:hypothetical protein